MVSVQAPGTSSTRGPHHATQDGESVCLFLDNLASEALSQSPIASGEWSGSMGP